MPKDITHTLTVADGPGAHRLADAFKYAHGSTPHTVDFTGSLKNETTGELKWGQFRMRIVGLEHEDGSGVSFNIRGVSDGSRTLEVKGYYNSSTKEGSLTFSVPTQ